MAAFFIVPLYALVQSRGDPARLTRIIAGNNIFNALFIVLSAAMSRPSRIAPLKNIALAVGESVLPERATPEGLRQIVMELRGDWK